MSDQKYNGWTNYETWAVKLWMDNEEPSSRYWQERARQAWNEAGADSHQADTRAERAAFTLADDIQENHEEAASDLLPEAGIFTDLLNAALSEVDWHEIAEDLIDAIDAFD
jgi:hypothetical protein